jgi:hypothetical protein
MKLITELTEQISYLSEAKESGGKEHFIEGIFLQADLKNRNGRVYPLNVMENEVSRYVREVVKANRAYGELGHPSGPSINLDRVSHIIVELKQNGTDFIGKAKITDTPMGNIARGLLESGANLGVSSRGLGSLKEEKGVMVVQSDYKIATAADIVADPSAPNAFVKGIMENVEWVYNPVKDSWHEEQLHETKKKIHKMSLRQIEEQRLAIFEEYITSLTIKS